MWVEVIVVLLLLLLLLPFWTACTARMCGTGFLNGPLKPGESFVNRHINGS